MIARYQAYLFFPLLLLEAAQLHVASAKAILRDTGRATVVEALLLLLHFVGYATALFLMLSPHCRRRSSSLSSRACSACTWAVHSLPTTKVCRR